ncbi:MAG: methyltransferase domain-containing protein [Acidobacteriaceae bacterium]
MFNLLKRGTGQRRHQSVPSIQRTSSALAELQKATADNESMTVLQLGPTSPRNISHFTNLGHGIYGEDIIAAASQPLYIVETSEGKQFDSEQFLAENLVPNHRRFDIALCWDTFDYIDPALAPPLAHRIFTLMKPGGYLLALFHSRRAGDTSTPLPTPHYRYHITGPGALDLQYDIDLPLKNTMPNRKIEETFRDFANVKFMLARDNIREVLARR